MDCSQPCSSVHGIFPGRLLDWVAISSSKGSSQPRDLTSISESPALQEDSFTTEPPGKPQIIKLTELCNLNMWSFFPSTTPQKTCSKIVWENQYLLIKYIFSNIQQNYISTKKVLPNRISHRSLLDDIFWFPQFFVNLASIRTLHFLRTDHIYQNNHFPVYNVSRMNVNQSLNTLIGHNVRTWVSPGVSLIRVNTSFMKHIYIIRLPRWLSSKEPAYQCKRHGFNPWVRKTPGEENGTPIQYSCLGNLIGRGAWWAIVIVHGVEKTQTWLSNLTNSNTYNQ